MSSFNRPNVWHWFHEETFPDPEAAEKRQAFVAQVEQELSWLDFSQFEDNPAYVSVKAPYLRQLAYWAGERCAYFQWLFEATTYTDKHALAYNLLQRALDAQQQP